MLGLVFRIRYKFKIVYIIILSLWLSHHNIDLIHSIILEIKIGDSAICRSLFFWLLNVNLFRVVVSERATDRQYARRLDIEGWFYGRVGGASNVLMLLPDGQSAVWCYTLFSLCPTVYYQHGYVLIYRELLTETFWFMADGRVFLYTLL